MELLNKGLEIVEVKSKLNKDYIINLNIVNYTNNLLNIINNIQHYNITKIKVRDKEYKIGDKIYLSSVLYNNYYVNSQDERNKVKIASFEYINGDIKVITDYKIPTSSYFQTIRAINLNLYNKTNNKEMTNNKKEVINSFVRTKDNTVWKREGETDLFRYKDYTHSFYYLNNNTATYKPVTIEVEQVKPEFGVVKPVNKKSICKNSYVTSDSWTKDSKDNIIIYQVRKVDGYRVYFNGYPDRVNNPIKILRLATQEELDSIFSKNTIKDIKSDKVVEKIVEKVVYKNSDKTAILSAIEKCRKKDFDDEEDIYNFLKEELNIN